MPIVLLLSVISGSIRVTKYVVSVDERVYRISKGMHQDPTEYEIESHASGAVRKGGTRAVGLQVRADGDGDDGDWITHRPAECHWIG